MLQIIAPLFLLLPSSSLCNEGRQLRRDSAYDFADLFAVLIENESRHSTNASLLRDVGNGIDVNFVETDICCRFGELLKGWRDHFAWTTPCCPEVKDGIGVFRGDFLELLEALDDSHFAHFDCVRLSAGRLEERCACGFAGFKKGYSPRPLYMRAFDNPMAKFLIFFVLPVPAWAVVTGFLVWDGLSAITDRRTTIDGAGHVGGILAGAAYYLFKARFRF